MNEGREGDVQASSEAVNTDFREVPGAVDDTLRGQRDIDSPDLSQAFAQSTHATLVSFATRFFSDIWIDLGIRYRGIR